MAVSQTLHRNVPSLQKEHGPFSHIRKASAVPPKPPKAPVPEGERTGKEKAPTERVLYTDEFGEEFEVRRGAQLGRAGSWGRGR